MVYGQSPGGILDGVHFSVPYFNWGWNYVVLKNSQQPELAYLFALFAATPQMSTLAVQQSDGFFDPFRPEHYADPQIQKVYSPAFLRNQQSIRWNRLREKYPAALRAQLQDLS